MCFVFSFVGLDEKKTRFSYKFCKAFLKRHPNISYRATFAVNRKKAREWNAKKAQAWIDLLSELHKDGFLEDPEVIHNSDESAFQLAEIYDKVYAAKGTNEVESYFDGDEKASITLLACGNAAGRMSPPLVLFDGSMHMEWRWDGVEGRCWIGVNSSGYMDCEIFTKYVKEELIPKMTAKRVSLCWTTAQ